MSNNDKTNSDDSNKKEIRKKPKIVSRIILILVCTAGLIWGYFKITDMVNYVSTEDASIDGEKFSVSSKMLGRIQTINVEEGDKVNAGDTLVLIDPTNLKAQESQARASLSYARKNLELSRISLGKTRNDYNRIQNLYQNSAATKESYEHARNALDTAQAQYNLVQAQVETSQTQIGVIEAQLKNTEIPTPINGTVDTITLSEGDVVQPGQTILTVNNLNDVWVIANIKETEISRVKKGATVKITVDALRKTPFEGHVEKIYAGIVPPPFQIGEFTKTTQRIPVKILLSEKGQSKEGSLHLLPGMSVEVKVQTEVKFPWEK